MHDQTQQLAFKLGLRLQGLAAECSPAELHPGIARILREVVSFDAYDWMVARNCRKRYDTEAWYSVGTPKSMYDIWPKYRHRQRISAELFSFPTRSLVWVPEKDEPDEEIKEVLYRPECFGSTAVTQCTDAGDRTNIISMVRFGKGPHFGRQDAELLGILAPLMISTMRLAWLRQKYETLIDAVSAQCTALADEDGRVQQSDERFPSVLQQEWPDWEGPLLPLPLRRIVIAQGNRYLGKRLCGSIQRTGGGIHIELRERQPCDRLTDRERRIADLYASGKCHKEIGQLLELAPSTVRTRLSKIYLKLDVGTKVGLLAALSADTRARS